MDNSSLKAKWTDAGERAFAQTFDFDRLAPGCCCAVHYDDHGEIYSVRPGFFEDEKDVLAWLRYFQIPSIVVEKTKKWVEGRKEELDVLYRAIDDTLLKDAAVEGEISSHIERVNRIFSDAFPRVQVLAWGSLKEVLSSSYYSDAFSADAEEVDLDEEARPSLELKQLLDSGRFDDSNSTHLAMAKRFFERHEVEND